MAGLLIAGGVDSFGFALGWTVFTFIALREDGLAAVGVYNAAVFAGTVAAAPATAWLTRRLSGRALLEVASAVEAVLRVVMFAMLLAGLPVAVTAAVVLLGHVIALTGYACMRAEVDALSSAKRGSAMTTFIGVILGAEAIGAAVAAILPGDPPGSDNMLPVVIAVYAGTMVPTFLVGAAARVGRTPDATPARGMLRDRALRRQLFGAAGLMAVASGPTLLFVALTTDYLSAGWVAPAAIMFLIGMLFAPAVVGVLFRRGIPARVVWPMFAVGMLIGWVLVAAQPVAVIGAQLLSGLCMASFEGHMDDTVSAGSSSESRPRLALTESARSVGYAVSAASLPVLATRFGFDEVVRTSAICLLILLVATALASFRSPQPR